MAIVTIEGIQYNFDTNMTWGDWVTLPTYSHDAFAIEEGTNRVITSDGLYWVEDEANIPVYSTDMIDHVIVYITVERNKFTITFDDGVVGYEAIAHDPLNPTTIDRYSTEYFRFSLHDSRYALNTAIVVTGCTYDWKCYGDEAIMLLTQPTDNVKIYMGATQLYWNIEVDYNPDHIYVGDQSATRIGITSGEATLYFEANEDSGYALPNTVAIFGQVEHSWDPAEGVLYLRNAYSDVRVVIEARKTFPIEFTINGEPYQFIEGMTFQEWIDSEYCPDSFAIQDETDHIVNKDTWQRIEDPDMGAVTAPNIIQEYIEYILVDIPRPEAAEYWFIRPQTLIDIADAIRLKKGTDGKILVPDLASEIESIDTSGTQVVGTIDITENGEHDVASYAKANVNVNRPQLFSPSLSISGDTLTINDSSNNGAHTTAYDIYIDGVYKTTIEKE